MINHIVIFFCFLASLITGVQGSINWLFIKFNGDLIFSVRPSTVVKLPVIDGAESGFIGSWDYCPPKEFVIGFKVDCDPSSSFLRDKTGLNGIRLYCASKKALLDEKNFISSLVNYEERSEWSEIYLCPNNSFVNGIELKQDKVSFFHDDTGANSMRVHCVNNEIVEAAGSPYGEWSGMKTCPPFSVVCGIRTLGFSSMGLTTLDFACCERKKRNNRNETTTI